MKIAVIIIRILVGLMFLFSSVVVLFNLVPQPVVEGDVKLFNEGLAASGYLVPLLKVIELLCAIAFLSGRFIPLAAVVIFPITVNILLFHAFLAPEGVVLGAFMFLGNLFLAYANRKKYEPILAVK
jgi:uncharacterized membrane protein YphA (DoxX/SURF4 family)